MTSEQSRDLLNRVAEVLGEHAHAFVIAAEVDHDGETEATTTMIYSYDGGMTRSIGLAERLLRSLHKIDAAEPDDLNSR